VHDLILGDLSFKDMMLQETTGGTSPQFLNIIIVNEVLSPSIVVVEDAIE
jgi:hypothetical protein